MHADHAIGVRFGDCIAYCADPLIGRRIGDMPARQVDRRFIEDAGWGAALTADAAADWVRRLFVDPGNLEGGAVQPGRVAVLTAQQHRPVADDRVQVGRRRPAAIPEGVIPATTLQPARSNPGGRRDCRKRILEICDAIEPDATHRQCMPDQMDMRVGQRRDGGPATQIDPLGLASDRRLDLALAAHCNYASVTEGDRLDTRLGGVHCIDRAIVEDRRWHSVAPMINWRQSTDKYAECCRACQGGLGECSSTIHL